LKGYHVSEHIPKKKEQLFSYLSWGIGENCILCDLIYIVYVPEISYYPNGERVFKTHHLLEAIIFFGIITIIHSQLPL